MSANAVVRQVGKADAVGGDRSGLDELSGSYLEAILSGERGDARELLRRASAAGTTLRTIYLGVLQPALRRVGELWEEDCISVEDEHLATSITQSLMVELGASLFQEPETKRGRLLAACIGSERHVVGLHMLCDLLELEGWDTTYLGGTVAVDELLAEVREHAPDVVALSCSLSWHLPHLTAAIGTLRAEMRAACPMILVGGRPFVENPDLAREAGADLTASDAGEALEVLRSWRS